MTTGLILVLLFGVICSLKCPSLFTRWAVLCSLLLLMGACSEKEEITEKNDVDNSVLLGIPENDLNGWEEGFLINDEYFFVASEDSLGGTTAYFNEFNKDVEHGLIVEYNQEGYISQIHESEYLHIFNYSDDSLYVTSIPVDTLSNKPIKYKGIAYDHNEFIIGGQNSRVSEKTMEGLARLYLIYSVGKKVEITEKDLLSTLGQIALEEAIQAGLIYGVKKAVGSAAGIGVQAAFIIYDAIKLHHDVMIYTYFGHARLNSILNTDFNPNEFILESKKFQTLPSPQKYGNLPPFEYEYGVLLDGKTYIGPLFFKTGEMPNLGKYKLPELEDGHHYLVPYLMHKNTKIRVEGFGSRFFVFKPKPKYSIGIDEIIYQKGKVLVDLNVQWTPVNSSYIEYQGISFTKPNGKMFCNNLSAGYMGGNVSIKEEANGIYSKEEFQLNYTDLIATANLKIEYWIKFKNIYETKTVLLENYEIVYDQKPSIAFTSASVSDTKVLYAGSYGKTYESTFNYTYNVQGALWLDKLVLKCSSDMQGFLGDYNEHEVSNDGICKNSFTTKYESYLTSFSAYLDGVLPTGKTYRSTNTLLFEGSPMKNVVLY